MRRPAPIRVMEPDLVAQIKAGEVIERPASVVKELLENAIDAGARRIRVEIAEGGARLIRVIDDGTGIAPAELALAFAEHTSSKLHGAEELGAIQTLGFRGEALYAVSNVSRVEAVSGLRGSVEAGTVTFDHGDLLVNEPAAPGGGTRITVHDLFAKVPARRKHLKTARSESAAIHQVVAQYAVGHPDVAMTLLVDGRSTLTVPGNGRLEDAFGAVYGADLVDHMIPIRRDDGVDVSGLVSMPDLTRSQRTGILISVNGRPVRSAALTFAVEDAYAGLLMVGRHPMAAILIDLPSGQLDPNVHPTKLEVRFLADRAVFSAVRASVARALAVEPLVAEPVGDLAQAPVEEHDRTALMIPEGERRPYPRDVSFEPRPPGTPAPSFQHALPALRVFGQAAQTFIIAEGPSGLYMIDQHAAHERILFDSLTNKERRARQPLLDPARLELSMEQCSTLELEAEQLAAMGFEVEPFGDRWCLVRSVPLAGGKPLPADVIPEVLDAVAEARSTADIANRALTVVACQAAIKSGQSLSMAEMRELVSSLERTDNPRTCPHGRPTMIHISTERLEREFGRR